VIEARWHDLMAVLQLKHSYYKGLRMSTSVRLPPRVEQALTDYCVSQRVSKSELLIRAINHYLASSAGAPQPSAKPDTSTDSSAIFQAFAASGFIAKVAIGQERHGSATKQRVADAVRQAVRRQA
jgi:hypothetical protein